MEHFREDGVLVVEADSASAWREWLTENFDKTPSVWLIIYKKKSGIPSVTYKEAVLEALCFGWIDSKPNKRDDNSYFQYFAKRSPKSNWSKVNKDYVQILEAEGKIHPSGAAMIALAKSTGTWDALNDIDNLVIPDDLKNALIKQQDALSNFENFPRSVKRGILEWIFNAKRKETRVKRIATTAEMASRNERANQYRKK